MEHITTISELIQYAFYSLISFLAVRMVKSMDDLNVKIAVVIQRADQHDHLFEKQDRLFEKQDSRITKLEEEKNSP